MKKNLLIIGSGGHGRCCLDIAREKNIYKKICFLDDALIGTIVNGAEVLDKIENLTKYQNEFQEVFVAIGNNKFRKEIQQKVIGEGFQIADLISQRSYVSDYAEVGQGSVVFPGAVIEANAIVGDGCIITSNATVNHDARVDDFSLIYSNTVVRPNVHIGELSRVGSGCVVRFGMTVESGSDVPDGTII